MGVGGGGGGVQERGIGVSDFEVLRVWDFRV